MINVFRLKKQAYPPHLDIDFQLIRDESIDHFDEWQSDDQTDFPSPSQDAESPRRRGLTTLEALELIRLRFEAHQHEMSGGRTYSETSRYAA